MARFVGALRGSAAPSAAARRARGYVASASLSWTVKRGRRASTVRRLHYQSAPPAPPAPPSAATEDDEQRLSVRVGFPHSRGEHRLSPRWRGGALPRATASYRGLGLRVGQCGPDTPDTDARPAVALSGPCAISSASRWAGPGIIADSGGQLAR